jgi:myo-inositol 2-dehydrogenase/D-chiro-inositol 1-dehydrogenase
VSHPVKNLLGAIGWRGAGRVRARVRGGGKVRKAKINGQIFDHHFVEFEYADGSMLYSQSCQMPGHCRRMVEEHAVGTLGKVNLANGGRLFEITGENPWVQRLKNKVDAHQDEHYPFFEAIRNNDPYAEAKYGAESTMMAILGRMATYSGKVVTWEEAMAMENKLVPDDLTSIDSEPPVLPDGEGWYATAVPGESEPW